MLFKQLNVCRDPDDILDFSVVQIQPAESTKDSLSKDFEKLALNAAELVSALKARQLPLSR